MTDLPHPGPSHPRPDGGESSRAEANGHPGSAVDLRTQLNRAYLSGDGAAVERVLALLEHQTDASRAA